MSRISLVKDVTTALRGADDLVVVLPKKLVRILPRALPDTLGASAARLADRLEPGAAGACGWTLTEGERPLMLGVVVVPDEAARHNHPARPEVIQRLVGSAPDKPKKLAVLALLADPAHQVAVVGAVARAFPLLHRGSHGGAPTVALALHDAKGQAIGVDPWTKRTLSAVHEAAELVDTPPSELHPGEFSARAKKTLSALRGVKVTEIAGTRLSSQGFGGIWGVGKAAANPPRLVVAQYTPRGASVHVALVGKGVTYDTGGLHLKPRGFMEGMKMDMGGAAAVFGAFRVLVENKVKVRVSLLLCLAENAIGPDAYKPDDILTLHSGKTVEINNTDAEGRLLLADGVSYAARKLGADVILDAATLTGAQLVATGQLHAAIVSNDAELERALVSAGQRSGDLAHPLIFAPELFQKEFESPVADMRNSVKNRMNAQTSCAAQFVYAHLEGTDARWGHVDLAGPAWRDDRGTGYGAALLSECVRSLA